MSKYVLQPTEEAEVNAAIGAMQIPSEPASVTAHLSTFDEKRHVKVSELNEFEIRCLAFSNLISAQMRQWEAKNKGTGLNKPGATEQKEYSLLQAKNSFAALKFWNSLEERISVPSASIHLDVYSGNIVGFDRPANLSDEALHEFLTQQFCS